MIRARRSPQLQRNGRAETMKTLSILAAIAVPVLIALTLLPQAAPYAFHLTIAALAVAGLLLALVVAGAGTTSPPPARVQAAQPQPVAVPHQAEAEVVGFLGVLQEKGRLVDFLMEDITAYNDQQIGAAARVVHQGCRAALQEHLDIRPIREEAEGAKVTVTAGYAADEYRLVGKISGEAPFTGTLVHRGWRAVSVKLPRVLNIRGDRLPAVAPAEVELK